MPDITGITVVPYRSWRPGGAVIVVDRIEPGVEPEYCIHGRATCVSCPEWVWLGNMTHDLVVSGKAVPMCHPCASFHQALGLLPSSKRVGNVRDHRRADGPHE